MIGLALVCAFLAVTDGGCGDDDAPPGNVDPNPDGAANPNDGQSQQTGDSSMPGNEDADSGPTNGLSPTFVHRDINHVLSTGQSLSVGSSGTPPLSTTQPYANTMFSRGLQPGGTMLTDFAPLVEATVETMSAGMANLVTKMAREELLVGQPDGKKSHDMLFSLHGIGGTAYVGLKKGTGAFTNGMAQAKAGFDLAKAMNKSYVVRAVTNVHGESDHIAANANYEADLVQWQSDYEKDVQAITGQTDPIPMLHTQMSSWTKFNSPVSVIPIMQLAASVKSNGKIVMVGPKYHVEYVGDGVHLTAKGYRQMGEDYAKVYRKVILEGKKWEPLRPISVTRVGAVITVKFVVPSPPLVLDTTLVTDPGKNGFEYFDTVTPPAIQSVALTGPDTVTITLASEPIGTNRRLRYAYTGTVGANAGATTGPRGNLRDSDPTVSRNNEKLYNWCVHFDELVP
jgi:hypothetical protein